MATTVPPDNKQPIAEQGKEPFLAIEQATRASTVVQAIIPANGLYPVNQYGNRFYFRIASSGVLVRSGQGVEKPYIKGQGENYANLGVTFNRLEIRNPNAFDVFVQVWVGFGEYLDSTYELIEAPSKYYPVILTGQEIAASAYVILNGNPSGVQLQRKAVIVSNNDLANSLIIKDVDPITNLPVTGGLAVFARTSIRLDVSGPIAIVNETASDIACYVSELWNTYI